MPYNPPKYFAPMMAALTAFLVASCFATKPVFFQYLVSAKQWQLEQGVILAAVFMAVSLPFTRNIRITIADAGVFLLASWLVLSAFLIHNFGYQSTREVMFHVMLWLAVYGFVRAGAGTNWFHWSVAGILLVVALLQSVLGLMQLYGFEASNHGLFKITGTFHNPGPFSGFVVRALPLAVVGYLIGDTEKDGGSTERHGEISSRGVKINFNLQKVFSGVLKSVSLLTIIAILLIVPAAQSRAAWLAGIAGCLYVFLTYPGPISFRNKLQASIKRSRYATRLLIITATLLVIIGAGMGLYLMKQGSANGRLLMWQVTTQLIKDRPVTGHGSGAFTAIYMDEQADWFESGKGTDAQAAVAGSPEAPFNEPLKLWLEKGLIGVLLAGGILGLIFFPGGFNTKHSTRNQKPETRNYEPINPHPIPPNPLEGEPQSRKTRNSEPETQNPKQETLKPGLKGTLISILTFSLFSYPFDISSFILQLVVVVALLSSATPVLATIKGQKNLLLTMPIIVILILGGIWYFPKRQAHYAALETWQEANQFYSMRSYNIASETYEEAFPVLKTNGLFLQMYGKALNMDEKHEKSNKILALAQKHMSSYIIQNTLGNNYKALGNYSKAETAYQKSTSMVPGLLLPKYLLAKLYVESDQPSKAKQTAQNLLNSPVKIESTATQEILEEMKEIVTQSTTE